MPAPPSTRRASRLKYLDFRRDYKLGTLDKSDDEAPKVDEKPDEPNKPDAPDKSAAGKKAKRREHLRAYMRWLWPYKFSVAFVFALALFTAVLQMLEPLFMRFIIDVVLLASPLDPASWLTRFLVATGLDQASRPTLLNFGGAGFLALIVLSNLTSVLKDYRQRVLNIRVMLSLRRALFDRLLHLPLPKLWDMKTGGILSRLSGDVDTTTGLMQLAVVSPAVSVVRLLVAVGILMALNWRLALTALAIIPGAMLMSFVFAKRVRPIYRVVRKDVEEIDGRAGETFSGIRVVRAFGRETRELLLYLIGRHTVLRKELFAQRREMVLWTSWGLLVSGVNVVIIWYGGYLYLQGGASVGDIMAFQWFTFLLLNPVWNLVNSFSELQRSLAAMERVFDILSMENDKPDKADARLAPPVVSEIRFEDVEFEYRAEQPVVKEFGVTVAGGSVVALVGRSGAGKTTVTDLVARFHDPTRGRILVNGTDIRDFTLRSYRDLLAIVQQDVFLFDGSVRDNIAYGRHNATNAEVEDAAQRANAAEFIEKMPAGYDTFVGERGVKLSGGQQQRLAIARAILKSPQILILDEATSNLDTESEQLIQAAMATLLAGRTTFIIAHRLSTIRRADLILLMEDGRIIERGTHETLMAAGREYAAMVERQMQQQQEEESGVRPRAAAPLVI